MTNMKKWIAATAIISVIGASMGGFAMAHGGKAGMGGKAMKGQMGIEQGMRGGKGGPLGPGSGGPGGPGGKGGVLGGIVNQQKYMSLLVAAYSPDTKAEWDTYLKAEKELQTQMDALHQNGVKPDRSHMSAPDQTTIDADQAAHEALSKADAALSIAITKDDATAIKTALKDLLAAKKQELALHAKRFSEMKAAATITTTPTPTTSNITKTTDQAL